MAAAGEGADVRIGGGGGATVRHCSQARLIEALHLAVAPVLLGGEPMFEGLDLPALGYQVSEHVATEAATHVVVTKSG